MKTFWLAIVLIAVPAKADRSAYSVEQRLSESSLLGRSGAGDLTTSGELTRCELSSSAEASLVEYQAGGVALYTIESNRRILKLYRPRMTDRENPLLLKQMAALLQLVSESSRWFSTPMGVVQVKLTGDKFVHVAIQNIGLLRLTALSGRIRRSPIGHAVGVDGQMAWEGGGNSGVLKISLRKISGSACLVKTPEPIKQALARLKLAETHWASEIEMSAPGKRKLATARALREQAKQLAPETRSFLIEILRTADKDEEQTVAAATRLATEGTFEAQRAIAQSAASIEKSPNQRIRLLMTLFLPTQTDAKAIHQTLQIFLNNQNSLAVRETALLVAASMASVSGSSRAIREIQDLLRYRTGPGRSASRDPFAATYLAAAANLRRQ